jgi:hypothetical protein
MIPPHPFHDRGDDARFGAPRSIGDPAARINSWMRAAWSLPGRGANAFAQPLIKSRRLNVAIEASTSISFLMIFSRR